MRTLWFFESVRAVRPVREFFFGDHATRVSDGTRGSGVRGMNADAKQHMVRLRFAEPLRLVDATNFYRIALRREHLEKGEGDFFKPEMFQPSRSAVGSCSLCKSPLHRVGEWHKVCRKPGCRNFNKPDLTRPARGVIQVVVPPDWVRVLDGVACCDSLLLVLDRRYDTATLQAVYRTAGALCEMMGWKLL